MTSYATPARGVAPAYYRPAYVPSQPAVRPNVTDDYERTRKNDAFRTFTKKLFLGWYTEATPLNRMLLSLRSGIDADIGWALNRLCRLCDNEQFVLKTIPGLIDALFEWPEWYANEGYKEHAEVTSLFS